MGTATIDSYTPGENEKGAIIVSNIHLDPDRSMVEVRRVEYPDMIGGGQSFGAEVQHNGAFGIPAFDVIYLQAAVAGTILLLGSIGTYLFVGSIPKSVDFLIATDGEMKKVNWSTRKEIQGSTAVVVIASFLLAIMIFFVDLGFQQIFRAVGVLQ
ncbi:MAG TPA: preprotein translocase subunit SecE [Phycisphaerales bacterium]|nr:preprotein translocase subunit SecE [Phycisphaerales bacterium]